MPNRPEFLAVWIGVTRVGGVTALLNTNLVGPSLAHCIDIAAPKHIIVAAELLEPFLAVLPSLKSAPKVWVHGDNAQNFPRIDRAVENFPAGALVRRRAAARSPSRTARFTSTRPARPACRRPPTSIITA